MRCAREAVDEMVRRPWSRELHLAPAHGGAGSDKFVLVALHGLPIDQVCDIKHHLSVIDEPAAHFFIERKEEPVHLEAHRSRPRLTLPSPRGVLPQIAQIFAANPFGGEMLLDFARAAVVDEDLEVHLGLAAQLVDVAEELTLVGANGLAEHFVVREDGAEPEGKYGGMLEAVGDDPCVIDAGFLVEGFPGIVLAHNNGEVTCRIKEYLIAANTKD